MQNAMKWPTNMGNSMYVTQFSILHGTEWCQLVHNTYSNLVSVSLIQICTFVPKLSSKLWLECTTPFMPTNMVNSMYVTQFSILNVTEWCQLVHNTYSKLVSARLIQICTLVPKFSSQSWLQCTIPLNGQQIWFIQWMTLHF